MYDVESAEYSILFNSQWISFLFNLTEFINISTNPKLYTVANVFSNESDKLPDLDKV